MTVFAGSQIRGGDLKEVEKVIFRCIKNMAFIELKSHLESIRN